MTTPKAFSMNHPQDNISPDNISPEEVAKFERLAQDWWDASGPMQALHDINPARLAYISAQAPLPGRRVLDVGCGGGILTEALARQGATVQGLDAGVEVIRVAQQRALDTGLEIAYSNTRLEDFVGNNTGNFDVITCMELLEHVPDPEQLLHDCGRALAPGGHLFLATINRNLKSYAGAILGAERLLRLLPAGTHDYAAFIRPAELQRWLRGVGFKVLDIRGLLYVPGLRYCALIDDPGVNYLVHAQR